MDDEQTYASEPIFDSPHDRIEVSKSDAQRKHSDGPRHFTKSPIVELELEYVAPNEITQPRTYFDERELKWLAESIEKNGVLQPILVTKRAAEYLIVAGERRYRAALQVGLTHIPAIIIHDENDHLSADNTRRLALIENLQRHDLNDLDLTLAVLDHLQVELELPSHEEVAKHLTRMRNKIPNEEELELGARTKELFRELGIGWTTFAAHNLRILRFPLDLREQLRKGNLDISKAGLLNTVKDEDLRITLTWRTIVEPLTREELKQEIADLREPKQAEEDDDGQREQLIHRITAVRRRLNRVKRKLPPEKIAEIDSTLATWTSWADELEQQTS